jgi:iron complex transport system substrate-binding protein
MFDNVFSQLYHPRPMGQYGRWLQAGLMAAFAAVVMLSVACDREQAPAVEQTGPPTVASVMPAVSEMVVAMGLKDRLVGVSTYDSATGETAGIERIGDYHKLDWEKLFRIRPAILVISRSRVNAEQVFQQRARQIGAQIVDVQIDRLSDVFEVIERLGEVMEEPQRAADLLERMQAELEAIEEATRDRPQVRTLIVLDERAQFAVGPRNFLDDLLTIAGGENVAAELERDYPKIDMERLLQLNPDVVIQLMPDATPQLVESARRFWGRLPQLNAVREGRVHIHTEGFLLLPGTRVVDVARKMAEDLHPELREP